MCQTKCIVTVNTNTGTVHGPEQVCGSGSVEFFSTECLEIYIDKEDGKFTRMWNCNNKI